MVEGELSIALRNYNDRAYKFSDSLNQNNLPYVSIWYAPLPIDGADEMTAEEKQHAYKCLTDEDLKSVRDQGLECTVKTEDINLPNVRCTLPYERDEEGNIVYNEDGSPKFETGSLPPGDLIPFIFLRYNDSTEH